MRRIVNLILACLLCLALPATACAEAEEPARSAAVFPASLLTLESEALAGTAIRTAVFPEGFRSIGDGAFSGVRELADVYLPASTGQISASAFPRSGLIRIHAPENSYAQAWAEEHSVAFVPEEPGAPEAAGAEAPAPRESTIRQYRQRFHDDSVLPLHEREGDEGISMRPQERPELNPIDYRFP